MAVGMKGAIGTSVPCAFQARASARWTGGPGWWLLSEEARRRGAARVAEMGAFGAAELMFRE